MKGKKEIKAVVIVCIKRALTHQSYFTLILDYRQKFYIDKRTGRIFKKKG